MCLLVLSQSWLCFSSVVEKCTKKWKHKLIWIWGRNRRLQIERTKNRRFIDYLSFYVYMFWLFIWLFLLKLQLNWPLCSNISYIFRYFLMWNKPNVHIYIYIHFLFAFRSFTFFFLRSVIYLMLKSNVTAQQIPISKYRNYLAKLIQS